MGSASLFYSAALILLGYVVFKRIQQHRKGPLPPGPRGLPLVGNLLDLPPPGTVEWTHWLKHKDQYGPISSVTVLGQRFVIIHDRKAVFDILETRALKSASRPSLVFAGDIVGYRDIMGMMPYNRKFRLHRKLTATQVSQKSILRYQSVQELEVLRFLRRLSADSGSNNDSNNKLQDHLNLVSGSVMLRTLYNYETDPNKSDPIVTNTNQVMEDFSRATTPGAWAVDLIPWLKYVPKWMPGAGFHQTAKVFRDRLMHSIEDPYHYVKQQMTKGNDDVSYVAGLIKDVHRQIDPEEESVISWTAASMLNAGTDTTAASLLSFFLAMILFPDVQKRAQEEIDRVVGDSRLPSLGDRQNLPYIRAIVEETTRWHTLAPMGFPHLTTEDDVYDGHFIPKDTLLFPAAAWLAHDPAVYHSPEEFKPERFLEPHNEPPSSDVVFGFGRRACPGKHLAEQILFLSIAQTLAMFDIQKAVDKDGNDIDVTYEMLPGVISRVKPFPHKITARSEKRKALLQ